MSAAVVLLSGGLDSATTLAIARAEGFRTFALSVRYGQRHASELIAAEQLARILGAEEHRVVDVDLAGIGGSALTDSRLNVPEAAATRGIPARGIPARGIPITYVPARNTVLLSVALAWAEVLGAADIFIGINSVDYSGYPDCRPEFLDAFSKVAQLATKAGVEGRSMAIRAPLLHMTKAQIIREGMRLNVDFGATVSCYQADEAGRACGACDSCVIRAAGFAEAGCPDPTRYADRAMPVKQRLT
ncbi:MAG: 7-cyano-7-deazaguanine synthase QueC [Pseudomonadota bacterium]|nr:7-cyano-7-deazaguanine synthase QueC [Pseudomonadota bacterium]